MNLWQSPCLSSSVEIIGLSWEYSFRVQHLPTACSKIWVSFTALFSSFSTNKQTTSVILIDSSHLEYSHTNSGSATAMKVFYECDRRDDEKNPPVSLPLKVLTALLSYILGTREIKAHLSSNRKPVLPRAEEDLYNLWELDLQLHP